MAVKSGVLDKWRDYFRTANSDIFDIIEHSIMVAASDCPKEFKLRRDRIAETLFSCKLTKCFGCDRVELVVPNENQTNGCKIEIDRDACEFGGAAGGSKESKVNSNRDDHIEINVNQVSNYSFDEAEALTDEIEQESQIVGEVLRIKDVINNSKDESNAMLFDSLRRLELMALSVRTLKATEIGKAVNSLRKHSSKDIRQLARTLIEGWKVLVDEWVVATEKLAADGKRAEGTTPESVNPSNIAEENEEEEGLPSPPMDDLDFFNVPIELNEFFAGMDEDGNLKNNWDFKNNCKKGQRPPVDNNPNNNTPKPSQRVLDERIARSYEKKVEQVKNQESLIMKNSGFVKPPNGDQRAKPSVDQRMRSETKLQQPIKPEKFERHQASPPDKPRFSDEAAEQMKLEATKRKLQERYQQAENAKRQRTVQVMELHDLPKHGLGPKSLHIKNGNNQNRHRPNIRR